MLNLKETVGPAEWYQAFRRQVRPARRADPLREAALAGRLGEWTAHLTGAVVAACEELGWAAVARGHLAEVLPVPRQEYLAVDVMAFPPGDRPGWRWPAAAFELENRPDLDRISYSIWKVGVVRCRWGAVFCYRREPEEIGLLLRGLTEGVMAALFISTGSTRRLNAPPAGRGGAYDPAAPAPGGGHAQSGRGLPGRILQAVSVG
ncbi:MAG: hypothetical protein ACP5OO_12135 [Chloroflexia bacterium]